MRTRHCVAYRGEKFARSFEDFWNRINESLVIARLMSFDRRHNRRHDVLRTTLFGQENFNAGAGGLCRLNEDEFVFVGQDHVGVTAKPERSHLTTLSLEKLPVCVGVTRGRLGEGK